MIGVNLYRIKAFPCCLAISWSKVWDFDYNSWGDTMGWKYHYQLDIGRISIEIMYDICNCNYCMNWNKECYLEKVLR